MRQLVGQLGFWYFFSRVLGYSLRRVLGRIAGRFQEKWPLKNAPSWPADDDFRKKLPRFSGEAEVRFAEGLHRFASARNLTNAHVALARLLNKNPHVVPIPGTSRIACLEQNAAATVAALSAAEIAELDALFALEQVAGARYTKAGMVGIE